MGKVHCRHNGPLFCSAGFHCNLIGQLSIVGPVKPKYLLHFHQLLPVRYQHWWFTQRGGRLRGSRVYLTVPMHANFRSVVAVGGGVGVSGCDGAAVTAVPTTLASASPCSHSETFPYTQWASRLSLHMSNDVSCMAPANIWNKPSLKDEVVSIWKSL